MSLWLVCYTQGRCTMLNTPHIVCICLYKHPSLIWSREQEYSSVWCSYIHIVHRICYGKGGGAAQQQALEVGDGRLTTEQKTPPTALDDSPPLPEVRVMTSSASAVLSSNAETRRRRNEGQRLACPHASDNGFIFHNLGLLSGNS